MILNFEEDKFLTKRDRELIDKYSYQLNLKKGEIVNRSKDECKGLVLVLKGELRTYMMSEEGREVTLYRIQEGDYCILSASCLLENIVFEVVIEAFLDSKIVVIPSHVMNSILKDNLKFENVILKKANERFSDVMWTMQSLLFDGIEKRLLNLIYDEVIANQKLEINLTHEEMAKLLGSSREVITRTLKKLSKYDFIDITRGKIRVVNLEKVKKIL